MKYIITETQLKLLIKEQQGVIKLNLTKDKDQETLRNYCKPVLMDKKIIDKHINKVDSEVNEYLTKLNQRYTKKYPEISNRFLNINELLSDIKPLMISSIKNNLYGKYGHIKYSDKNDMNLIFKKIYDTLNNSLQSNFVKKMAIKALITDENVDTIKNGVKQFFNEFKSAIHWLRVLIPRLVMNEMRKEHDLTAPKCTNLLVTNNEYGDKVQPYNPTHPPIIVDLNYVDTDTLMNPYLTLVNKTIDSFV